MAESLDRANQDSPEVLRRRLEEAEEMLSTERAELSSRMRRLAFIAFIAAVMSAGGAWIGNSERIQMELLRLRGLSEKKRADACENDLDEELAREKRLLEMMDRQRALIDKYQSK